MLQLPRLLSVKDKDYSLQTFYNISGYIKNVILTFENARTIKSRHLSNKKTPRYSYTKFLSKSYKLYFFSVG